MCSKEKADKIIADIKAKTEQVHEELMKKFDLVHVTLEQSNGNEQQRPAN